MDNSIMKDVLLFLIPLLAVGCICAAPFITFYALGRGPVMDEIKAAANRRLSLLALISIFFAPVFLISNYGASTLYLYAVYSVLLAVASILNDRLGKRRVWLVLLVWHTLNLMNLIGGSFSSFQIYSTGGSGIIGAAFTISGPLGLDCSYAVSARGGHANYCINLWIIVQMVVAFMYVLLHIMMFFVVGLRVAHYFGGEDDGPVEADPEQERWFAERERQRQLRTTASAAAAAEASAEASAATPLQQQEEEPARV